MYFHHVCFTGIVHISFAANCLFVFCYKLYKMYFAALVQFEMKEINTY